MRTLHADALGDTAQPQTQENVREAGQERKKANRRFDRVYEKTHNNPKPDAERKHPMEP